LPWGFGAELQHVYPAYRLWLAWSGTQDAAKHADLGASACKSTQFRAR
jgi:hypothetical protein